MSPEDDRGAARIHWLVAGRFSREPGGEVFAASPADLDAALAARASGLRASVPDRLGSGEAREISLEVRSLRSFTLGGVIEAVPELRALRALAERPPGSPEEVVSAVEGLVGPGKLSAACAGAMQGEPGPGAAPPAGAAAAVDAFVKAMSPGPGGPAAGAARKLREAIDAAVYGTAFDLLTREPVRGLESSWRGLRMLLGLCPAGSGLHVQLLDALPEDVARAVRARPPLDAFDEPDALFVTEPVGTADVLAELADLAEEMLAPCVAVIAPGLLGAPSTAELAARVERGDPLPPGWEALRAGEAARWLCAAVNPVVLLTEGGGAFRRTSLGSPAWGVASMLSASYHAQGAFAHAVGKGGALAAPAVWTVPEGARKGATAPTEAFLSIAAQRELAARGLLGLGSVLDSDRLVMTSAPAVSSAPGAAPLPAQLLTGRIVRFARWARRQIDPALPPDEVSALFEQAAGLFLFPGMSGAAALGARIRGQGAERVLHVAARVKATHALVPLSIEFDLPI